MSAIAYSEPYKLPAGILALAVHGAFFALLYFGINWQALPPQGMVVDIWESLPEIGRAPVQDVLPPVAKPEPPKPPVPPKLTVPPKPPAPPKMVEPVRAVAPPKSDIELTEKKKPEKNSDDAIKPELKSKKVDMQAQRRALAEQQAQAERIAQAEKEAQAEREALAEQERVRAEQAAATGKIVNEYVGKIRAKIKRNIVEPKNLPASIHGKFNITVLPGGSVLDVRLVQSSGSAAYDSAVERAILRSEPLPVPEDVTLFQKFREINFPFCPDKGEGKCEE